MLLCPLVNRDAGENHVEVSRYNALPSVAIKRFRFNIQATDFVYIPASFMRMAQGK
jgi:hypothetical protein